MKYHRTVYSVLHEVLVGNAGVKPTRLARLLIRGVYDPEVSDPDLVQMLVRCERILESKCSNESLQESALLIVWLDTTFPPVVEAVASWVENEFQASRAS